MFRADTTAVQTARRALRVLRAALPEGGPVYAHVGVTHRCDLTCSMCSIWKEGDRATEVSPEEHARIADALVRAGVLVVSLGGGEPFVRRDLDAVVAAYAGRGLEVRVLTNGLQATDERVAALARAGLAGASVSLDSLDAATFDRICEHEGAFGRAIGAIESFRRFLPPPRGPLVLNCVVSAFNLGELPALVDFAESRGFVASFLPVELPRPGDPENKFIRAAAGMAIPASRRPEVVRAYDELIALKRAGRAVFNSTRYLEASRDWLAGGPAPATCDAGRLTLSVSPEGRLAACHLGPSLGPAAEGDLVARFAAAERGSGPARAQPWCGPGCVRACWHEVSFTLRDPATFLETAVGRSRGRRRSRSTS